METLGVLDVDGLDVGVQTLLSTLLVVTLAGDANAETERNTLDTGLPDLLVQLGVEADVLGALNSCAKEPISNLDHKTHTQGSRHDSPST